ncbi:DMT family protein [Parapedomonas caeni]
MPSAVWATAGLLLASNIFMTIAWYGHLKFKHSALWLVILVSWGIAFFEYCLQVPANRIGHGVLTAPQLKGLQEIITLGVFAVFSWVWLGEPVTAKQAVGFGLIIVAAVLIFQK